MPGVAIVVHLMDNAVEHVSAIPNSHSPCCWMLTTDGAFWWVNTQTEMSTDGLRDKHRKAAQKGNVQYRYTLKFWVNYKRNGSVILSDCN